MTKSKLAGTPQHCEIVYALIRKNKDKTEMMYRLASSPKDLWDAIVLEEFHGTGHTKDSLKRLGWVARKIRIEEIL